MSQLSLEKLKEILQNSWSRETCYEPQQSEWYRENPAQGQCFVTALVVNDYFGGEIVKAKSSNGVSHYWNRIAGVDYDFTRSQFPEDEIFTEEKIVNRDDLRENERYLILKKTVYMILEKQKSA